VRDKINYSANRGRRTIDLQASGVVRKAVIDQTKSASWSLISFNMLLIRDEIRDQVPPR
jgi:hypothetical protein